MSDQLEQFLNPPEEEETGAQETTEADGQEIVKEEIQKPEDEQRAAAAKETPDVEGLKQAMLAERRKRQELEAELAKKAQEEKPYLGEEYEARFQETEQRFQAELVRQKLDLSESIARDRHADFDEKFNVFSDLIKQYPALYPQMVQQVNPAEFMYKTASNAMRMKEMENPEEYERKLKEKWEAEYKAKNEKKDTPPVSIAGARGAAGTHQAAWQGPASLDDILK